MEGSTRAQGVSLHVTDPLALRKIARIFGWDEPASDLRPARSWALGVRRKDGRPERRHPARGSWGVAFGVIIGCMGSRRVFASLFILLVAVCAQFASARSSVPVLGSRHFAPHGFGWGTSKPSTLFNGGDPSGKIWNIRWGPWGGRVAAGRGLNWIFRPRGGYYAQPVPIELRAHLIGRCSPGQPLAYLQLDVREPSRPGGALGDWFAWGGAHLLCG